MLSGVSFACLVALRDGSTRFNNEGEHCWQTVGDHKSNIGGGSVFSELSLARLLFINQEELCLIREKWERLR